MLIVSCISFVHEGLFSPVRSDQKSKTISMLNPPEWLDPGCLSLAYRLCAWQIVKMGVFWVFVAVTVSVTATAGGPSCHILLCVCVCVGCAYAVKGCERGDSAPNTCSGQLSVLKHPWDDEKEWTALCGWWTRSSTSPSAEDYTFFLHSSKILDLL